MERVTDRRPIIVDGWRVWVVGSLADPGALAERYVRWGPEAVAAEPGDWALVADRRGERRVQVDAFGGCPLFVRGREVTTALERPSWSGPVDPVGVQQHLTAHLVQPWRTLVQGVWRVPAGHAGGVTEPTRWRRAYRPVGSSVPLADAVSVAVRERCGGDVRVGLSGGLDSAVVAAAAPGVGLVSNRFRSPAVDEGPWIRATTRHLGRDREDVPSDTPLDVLGLLPEGAEPPLLGNHHLNALLHRSGCTLLTGFGGDEVFGHGFDVVREWARRGRPARALGEALALAVRYRHEPETLPRATGRWGREALRALLVPSPEPLRHRRVARFTHPLLARSREEQMRIAARLGATIAMPLLDPRVVASVVDAPASARCSRGRTRLHVRKAFHEHLAPLVRERTTKTDLSPTLRQAVEAALERYGTELAEGALPVGVSRSDVHRRRATFEAGENTHAAWLWRVVGLVRFLSWHTGRLMPHDRTP